jgi:acetyl esterase/lipase
MNNICYFSSPLYFHSNLIRDLVKRFIFSFLNIFFSILTKSIETMLDNSKRFVERAKEAKVDVQIKVWKDMFHGWHLSALIIKNAEEAIKNIG